MLGVLEINDIDRLADYRLLWNRLLRQTRNATFFQSLDWLQTYWRHFGGGQKLRVLMVSSGAETLGILPLVVRAEATRVGPIRVLTYPLDNWGLFYGPLGPNPTVTVAAGIGYVRRRHRDWDLFDLRGVDASGCDRDRTPNAMRLAGLHPRRQAWACGAVVQIGGAWEAYWQGRTKKWRHQVNRSRRRLSESGRVTYIRYRPEGHARGDGDPRWDLYKACLQIARVSRQRFSTSGTALCHRAASGFLRDLYEVAAAFGGLDLNLLLLNGDPVAFAYNYHYQGRITAVRTGCDPRYAACSPGTVLQSMILENSFRRGDRFYDLGVGSPKRTRPWATAQVTSYRYTYFPAAAVRANLLRMKCWVQDHFYPANKRHAQSRCKR